MAAVGQWVQVVVLQGIKKGLWVLWDLAKVLIPAAVVVALLDYSGWLEIIASLFAPVMGWFGLPGEGALVLVTGNLLTTYPALALILTLDLTVKQITILSAMLMVCHSAIQETALVAKAGANWLWVLGTRLASMVIAGLVLNWLL